MRTSQLQIRVTPAEKAALKRLAGAAGESVSRYVLARVLPSTELELARMMAGLGDAETEVDRRNALRDLALALDELPAPELTHGVPAPGPGWPPARANQVAALVETLAHRKGVEPPSWVLRVPAMERPVFNWVLTSLKPYQMRVAPVAYKRRNLFLDPLASPAAAVLGAEAPEPHHGPGTRAGKADERLLRRLDRELGARGLVGEVYLVGGAVILQALAADPGSANIDAMFKPVADVQEAIRVATEAEGAEDTAFSDLARRLMGGRGPDGTSPILEMPHLRLFEPLPEYVLAMKCAAMRLGEDFREKGDVRYLLRFTNVTTADAALSLVSRYVAARQLARGTKPQIERLLAS